MKAKIKTTRTLVDTYQANVINSHATDKSPC